jgi:hypothetical protein
MFNVVNLSYCASFIDAEGHIEFLIRPKKNGLGKIYNTHIYRMEVCNTDKEIIKGLWKDFGKQGSLFNRKPRITEKGTLTKPQLVWNISHRKFYRLLQLIYPFMRHKEKIKKTREILKWVREKNVNK